MRVLEEHEMHAVSGGSKDAAPLALLLAIGCESAAASAGLGFLVGNVVPGIGGLTGAGIGLVIGAAAGVSFVISQWS